MNKWCLIIENDSFIVEYNKETNTYRVSYFEDNHFKDEICFRGYKELEWKEEAPTLLKDYEEIKEKMQTPVDLNWPSSTCGDCPNSPSNGGSGNCSCSKAYDNGNTVTTIQNGGK